MCKDVKNPISRINAELLKSWDYSYLDELEGD